jgi:hypothetical protein
MSVAQIGEKRDAARTRLDSKREDRLVGGSFGKKENEERGVSAEIAMKLPAS